MDIGLPTSAGLKTMHIVSMSREMEPAGGRDPSIKTGAAVPSKLAYIGASGHTPLQFMSKDSVASISLPNRTTLSEPFDTMVATGQKVPEEIKALDLITQNMTSSL